MATKYKSNTGELIAIYRLEFYKKQKNWKFCHDVCKKVDPKPEPQPEPQPEPAKDHKSDFNKTYSVDADLDTNNASPLNHAFLETDADKYPAESPPDSNAGSVWPEHLMEQHYKVPAQEQDLKQKPWWESERNSAEWVPREAWCPPASPPALWQDAPREVLLEGGQEFYEQQDYNANCAGVVVGLGVGAGVGADWQARTHAWALRAAHADPPDEGEAAGELLRAADRWLHDREHREASLESFMLGAAAAPHSSELDLLALSGSECSLTASCVSTLSGSQLAARVGRHAAALRLLLREARVRDQLGNSRQSLEEPTRDPGPCPPPPHSPLQRQDTFVKQPCVKDSFVAGSFKAPPESVTGKGRGRLRVRPGVIGIGMGRPYRL